MAENADSTELTSRRKTRGRPKKMKNVDKGVRISGLTELESAVIASEWWMKGYNSDAMDWVLVFRLSHPESTSIGNSLKASVSRFKGKTEVKSFLSHLSELNAIRRKDIEDSAIKTYLAKPKDYEPGDNDYAVDMTDPGQLLNELNRRYNSGNIDEKTKNDITKMLADLLRMKEQGSKSDEDIMRFYTPIKCSECECYKFVERAKDASENASKTFK